MTITTDEFRCPRCGSYSVSKTENAFADVTLHEMTCEACHFEEDRRTDDRDFAAFQERWRGRLIVPIYDYVEDLVDVD